MALYHFPDYNILIFDTHKYRAVLPLCQKTIHPDNFLLLFFPLYLALPVSVSIADVLLFLVLYHNLTFDIRHFSFPLF